MYAFAVIYSRRSKNYLPELQILEDTTKQDPDKRNYIVSNKKILNTGFKMKWNLDNGIKELIKGFVMIRNNYHGNV